MLRSLACLVHWKEFVADVDSILIWWKVVHSIARKWRRCCCCCCWQESHHDVKITMYCTKNNTRLNEFVNGDVLDKRMGQAKRLQESSGDTRSGRTNPIDSFQLDKSRHAFSRIEISFAASRRRRKIDDKPRLRMTPNSLTRASRRARLCTRGLSTSWGLCVYSLVFYSFFTSSMNSTMSAYQ